MTRTDRLTTPAPARRRGRPQPLAAKVPEIALLFWALKLLTTGMGESMSDFLGHQNRPVAAAIGLVGLALAFGLQMGQRSYRAPYYWFMVMMVAVFGTMAADGVRIVGGVTYSVTTPLFAIATAAIFALWYRTEGTLSIHSITTRRRELFYWSAVLATFALGTAAGDLTAFTLHLGFFDSILLFAAIISIPALAWWRGGLDPTVAFWGAYVVTRPLGASIADWFSKPPAISGLGLGDGLVSLVALGVFVGIVVYFTKTRHDIQPSHIHARAPGERGAGLEPGALAAPAEN